MNAEQRQQRSNIEFGSARTNGEGVHTRQKNESISVTKGGVTNHFCSLDGSQRDKCSKSVSIYWLPRALFVDPSGRTVSAHGGKWGLGAGCLYKSTQNGAWGCLSIQVNAVKILNGVLGSLQQNKKRITQQTWWWWCGQAISVHIYVCSACHPISLSIYIWLYDAPFTKTPLFSV